MNPDRLASLLAQDGSRPTTRSPACPDENHIAGYVDGGLDPAVRQELERHLADCGHCLALVGLLSRERHAPAIESIDPQVVARAVARKSAPPERRWRLAPQWAAAATIVLAVPLLVQISRNLDGGVEGQGRPAPTAIRASTPEAEALQVLTPRAGTAVESRHVQFRWTPVAGSPYYDVRIVTDDGAVVVRQRVDGTVWQLPDQLQLQPGAEYFVHVDAYPSGDKPASSDHIPFRVSD